MDDRTSPDTELVWNEFHRLVNMTSDEIRTWLLTDAAGEEAFPATPDLEVSELGRRVVEMLNKRKVDLTPGDTDVMRQVVEYVEDRLENPPPEGDQDPAWRRSLMTVGHDPLKP